MVNAAARAATIDWLGDSELDAKPADRASSIFWRFLGWNLVLYLSALQVIDSRPARGRARSTARRTAGSSSATSRCRCCKPMIFFAVTLTVIGNLQLFEEPFILVDVEAWCRVVGDDDVRSSCTGSAFSDGDFGTASAVSWLLFAADRGC